MTRLRREVLALVATGTVCASLLDGVLLQIRRSYFTGGFLSRDSATSWGDRLLFAVGSLAVDAVCVSLGVVVALWIASRLRLGRVGRIALGLVCATVPLVVASLVEYQVFAHVGDAFDFGLMFDLVGRRPSEILAVVSGHVVAPLIGALVGGGLGLVALLRLNRRFTDGAARVGVRGPLVTVLVLAVGVSLLTTMMRTRNEAVDNGLRRKPAGQAIGSAVTWLTDVDRDGFGLLSRPADPAPFDARIYPFALDIPGNGVDEDGIAGDLPVGELPARPTVSPRFARTPTVVVVMLETFRADLIGAQEGGRAVTPVLNALAQEGGSATRVYSHNGYTVQSKYHLFTGRLGQEGPSGTLLDDFRRNGYEIAYFSGQDESFGGKEYDIGAARADLFYDARQDKARRYTTFTTAGSLGVSADVVLERVGAFLDRRDRARPLFLFVNLYDTHFPYTHRAIDTLVSDVRLSQAEIMPARAEEVRRMYRNTAANVDRAVGQLLDRVSQHGGRPPVTLVMADHGESLFDEGYLGHGYTINDVQTRIPLVVRGAPVALCEPAGQADLRAALTSALASPDESTRPSFRGCGDARVFQYLGSLDTPRQIAFTDAAGRVRYDLRDGSADLGDGRWVRWADLPNAARDRVAEVVHYWERLRLAPAPATGASS